MSEVPKTTAGQSPDINQQALRPNGFTPYGEGLDLRVHTSDYREVDAAHIPNDDVESLAENIQKGRSLTNGSFEDDGSLMMLIAKKHEQTGDNAVTRTASDFVAYHVDIGVRKKPRRTKMSADGTRSLADLKQELPKPDYRLERQAATRLDLRGRNLEYSEQRYVITLSREGEEPQEVIVDASVLQDAISANLQNRLRAEERSKATVTTEQNRQLMMSRAAVADSFQKSNTPEQHNTEQTEEYQKRYINFLEDLRNSMRSGEGSVVGSLDALSTTDASLKSEIIGDLQGADLIDNNGQLISDEAEVQAEQKLELIDALEHEADITGVRYTFASGVGIIIHSQQKNNDGTLQYTVGSTYMRDGRTINAAYSLSGKALIDKLSKY